MYVEEAAEMTVEEVVMGCCWHHYGPCWGPDREWYERETRMHRPRRRQVSREIVEDLEDYLQYLEHEMADVRRELETLTTPDPSTD